MEKRYIISINYYKDRIKNVEIKHWYNTGKYIVYENANGHCEQVKLERVKEIKEMNK